MKYFSQFLLAWLISQTIGICDAKYLRLAISSSPNSLSPFFSTDANSQNINRLVHKSLIDFDESLRPFCVICESYEERKDATGYSITFTLKSGLTFWDGTLLNSDDIKKSVEYFTTDSYKIRSVFRFAFRSIKRVEILSDAKVRLHYDNYNLEHISNLALLKIIKIQNYAQLSAVKEENIIGLGRYQVKSEGPLKIMLVDRGKDEIDLEFSVVKDDTTLALKLLNSEIDISLSDLPPKKIVWLKERTKNYNFLEQLSSNYKYIGLNMKNEHLNNLLFRQALSMLIPREQLAKYKLHGSAELATGVLSEAFQEYYLKGKVNSYDPDAALQKLEQAGYKRLNGRLVKGSKPVSLTWKISNSFTSLELVTFMKDSLEKTGISINLMPQEWGTFMRAVKRGEFDLILGQWVGFTGPDILSFLFHSKKIPPHGANRGNFIDEKLDKLLDKATYEVNSDKRIKAYKDVQAYLVGKYPYIHLWHPKIIWIARKCVKNLHLYPNASFLPLLNIAENCKNQ